MSRLFLSKLEFTLIFSLIVFTGLSINTRLYAQNLNTNHQIERISELIEKLENYKEYISQDSLDISKDLVDKLSNDTNNNFDTELLDEIAIVHLDFLNTLVTEAENKIKLEIISNKITEERQLYDKLLKYNSEITEELKNHR
jgi:hypothetical protein